MGGMAAAASLARLDEERTRHAISYAAQQVSGLWSCVEDADHVEKAFDIGGMGARNGVTAVVLVQSGCTGVRDVLTCRHNALQAPCADPRPEEMMAGMGERCFVSETGIKTFPVCYRNQAPLDALRHPAHGGRRRPPRAQRPIDGAGAAVGALLPPPGALPGRPPPSPRLAPAPPLHPRRLRLATKVRAAAGGGRSADRRRHRHPEVQTHLRQFRGQGRWPSPIVSIT
jgi:hypothetical protein